MKSLKFALLPLLGALVAGGIQPVRASSEDPPASNHETVEQHWPDGTLRERKQVLRLPDGTTVDDGPFVRWYIDGTKEYEVVFAHGKKEGTETRYHRNGKVASRHEYRDGKRNGPSISWNDQGKKVKQENWTDGRPDGTWTVWNDGKVAWTHTFVQGAPDP